MSLAEKLENNIQTFNDWVRKRVRMLRDDETGSLIVATEEEVHDNMQGIAVRAYRMGAKMAMEEEPTDDDLEEVMQMLISKH